MSSKRVKRPLGKEFPDWEVEESIAKDGVTTHTHFYKGQRALCVLLDSPLAMALSGYALIDKDLRNITFGIERVRELLKKQFAGSHVPDDVAHPVPWTQP